MTSRSTEPSLHRTLMQALPALESTHPLRDLLPLAREIERICETGNWTLTLLSLDTGSNLSGRSPDSQEGFSFRLRRTDRQSLGLSDTESQ